MPIKPERIKNILDFDPGHHIYVSGWIRTKRESKNICFLDLSDGSCLDTLQIIIDRDNPAFDDAVLKVVTTGASVSVSGELRKSPGEGQKTELVAEQISVLGEADPEAYPLQKKRHSMEFLRELAHLRPRTNTFSAVSRVASRAAYAIHTFFQDRDFFWLRSPLITGIDAEGAGNMFQVTTLDASEKRIECWDEDFFGKKTYLAVTGQLEAETYATALGNVYTFGPTFRAENSNTSRHLAEFWMVEPEIAFCDIQLNMDIAEEFLKYVLSDILSNCKSDMAFFDKWIHNGICEILEHVINSDFKKITYTEAISILSPNNEKFEFKANWGCDLQSEHEKYLTEQIFNGPVIVTDYPKDIKAFYMKLNDDGRTVRAMDVLVPRLGEIIGGSERENLLELLEKRMDERGMKKDDYWWYLDLRRYGTVPHSGFGLGFERFVQYITGMQNIRDVIPFPRTVHSADF